jgi:hypothetical protein
VREETNNNRVDGFDNNIPVDCRTWDLGFAVRQGAETKVKRHASLSLAPSARKAPIGEISLTPPCDWEFEKKTNIGRQNGIPLPELEFQTNLRVFKMRKKKWKYFKTISSYFFFPCEKDFYTCALINQVEH